jgi:hypothetical protein
MKWHKLTYPYGLEDAKSPVELLERMESIVMREQIVHRVYVSTEIDDDVQASGAICGGHRFCAIGTMLFAAGVPVELERDFYEQEDSPAAYYPTIASQYDDRDHACDLHDHLMEARDALNQVAKEYIATGKYGDVYDGFDGCFTPETARNNPDPIEVLFENGVFDDDDRDKRGVDVLLEVIREAKSRVLAPA